LQLITFFKLFLKSARLNIIKFGPYYLCDLIFLKLLKFHERRDITVVFNTTSLDYGDLLGVRVKQLLGFLVISVSFLGETSHINK